MFENYLLVALRNFKRSKLHSTVNVLGLALAFAAAILIFLFSRNELSFDAFHEKADSIFLIYKERITPTGLQDSYDTWVPMAQALKSEYSTVLNATRFFQNEAWVSVGGKRLQEEITYVDSSFFEIFSFEIAGPNSFADLNSAFLSKKMAVRLFGHEDVIGKNLNLNYTTDYVVRGILQDYPENSSLSPEFVVPFRSIEDYDRLATNWGSSFIYTFLQLAETNKPASLEMQFPNFVTKNWNSEANKGMKLKLLSLLDWHDAQTGARQYAYILLGVAVMILSIAAINFANLTTALSFERAREIGMRKVLGGSRWQLVSQFLCEANFLSLIALAIGIFFVHFSLPYFNNLYELSLQAPGLVSVLDFLPLAGLALLIGSISGFYPALVISGFRPAKSLRGELKTSPGSLKVRSGMVITQFALAIILMVATAVMQQQVKHMKDGNLNFNRERVLSVVVRGTDFKDRDAATVRLESFKNELRAHSNIHSVASSTHIPGRWPGWFTFVYPSDRDESQRLRHRVAFVDEHFFKTYQIEFTRGRNFSRELQTDEEESVIINEAALRDFGWHDTETKQIRIGDNHYNIVGIVSDYHYETLASEVAPVIHRFRSSENGVHRIVSVKLGEGEVASTLEFIRESWQRLDPERTFEYSFVGDNFDREYTSEERLSTVTKAFTTLAIIVAGLGLFALSSLIIKQRTKEIGVRKTLGATTFEVVFLISKLSLNWCSLLLFLLRRFLIWLQMSG